MSNFLDDVVVEKTIKALDDALENLRGPDSAPPPPPEPATADDIAALHARLDSLESAARVRLDRVDECLPPPVWYHQTARRQNWTLGLLAAVLASLLVILIRLPEPDHLGLTPPAAPAGAVEAPAQPLAPRLDLPPVPVLRDGPR